MALFSERSQEAAPNAKYTNKSKACIYIQKIKVRVRFSLIRIYLYGTVIMSSYFFLDRMYQHYIYSEHHVVWITTIILET